MRHVAGDREPGARQPGPLVGQRALAIDFEHAQRRGPRGLACNREGVEPGAKDDELIDASRHRLREPIFRVSGAPAPARAGPASIRSTGAHRDLVEDPWIDQPRRERVVDDLRFAVEQMMHGRSVAAPAAVPPIDEGVLPFINTVTHRGRRGARRFVRGGVGMARREERAYREY